MHKEMRRAEKALSNEEMLEIMNSSLYGVLSTVDKDGIPYGVPLSFVYDDNHIYFHCATVGQKLDNISDNNNVSFCVVTDVETIPEQFNTKYKSVIAFGKVFEVLADQKEDIFKKLIYKYSKDFMVPGMEYIKKSGGSARIYQIEIDHITAKGKK